MEARIAQVAEQEAFRVFTLADPAQLIELRVLILGFACPVDLQEDVSPVTERCSDTRTWSYVGA
jgi:hypothetical protein